MSLMPVCFLTSVYPMLLLYFISVQAHTPAQMHTYACTSLVHGIMPTLQWCLESVWLGVEAVTAGSVWITITSWASRTQLSTPASRAAERGPGIYAHNYYSLLYGFKRLTVWVCVCVRHMMACVFVFVWFREQFNCISITHLFTNLYFGFKPTSCLF